jgi:hypothetical protein
MPTSGIADSPAVNRPHHQSFTLGPSSHFGPASVKCEANQADTTPGRTWYQRQDQYRPMNRLQLAHLPLRTKLIVASAATASLALLIAALTQGISSYFYSHS